MKKTFLLSIALLFTFLGIAQTDHPNTKFEVEVHDLEYHPERYVELNVNVNIGRKRAKNAVQGRTQNDQHKEMVPEINEMVKEAISKVNRFNCTQQLSDEHQGFQLTGVITDISTYSERKVYESKDKHGKITRSVELTHHGHVSLSLTLTDMSNHLFHTQEFERSDYTRNESSTPQTFLESLISMMGHTIEEYYNDRYPVQANILDIAETKKDKIKKLYLDVGQNDRIKKGQHFDIFHVKEVAGHTTQENIGRVKVEEVSGLDACLCKVQKGSKEIKTAVDTHQKLIAIYSK